MTSLIRLFVALMLLAAGVVSAQQQQLTTFEVATIKPTDPAATGAVFRVSGRRIAIHNQTVVRLLMYSYDVTEARIEGAPGWCRTEHFDIDGALETAADGSRGQVQKIVQALLAERFGLKLHHVQRPMPVFVLQAEAGRAKLPPSVEAMAKADPKDAVGNMSFTGMTMEEFAAALKYSVDRPVVDETGLKGRYDVSLRWTPDGRATDDPAAPPALLTALREQLGLKLKAERRPVDVVVVDAVQQPSPN